MFNYFTKESVTENAKAAKRFVKECATRPDRIDISQSAEPGEAIRYRVFTQDYMRHAARHEATQQTLLGMCLGFAAVYVVKAIVATFTWITQ